ncbi:MAG: amidohydrolase [Acidobacteria bacterium]|nr:amidohydrolase [Acidobacteriota bacterium]
MKTAAATLLVLSLPALATHAADSRTSVAADLSAMKQSLVETRRELHMYPELSNREAETSKRIAAWLTARGIPHETGIARHGVAATIKGAKPGPTIAVRADIDGLPIEETLDLPYKSKNRGVKHACGHDVHTTIALATAELLWKRRASLPGTVVVFFQPAEEGPPPGENGGAPLMIEEGFLDRVKPEAMFALHVWPPLRAGEAGFNAGPMWASSDRFKITVNGKGSHGAQPHLGIDPIVVGAQIVMALQTIDSRRVDPLQPVVVTVGSFHGGTRFNIVPPSVELEGTIRTLSPAVRAQTIELLKKLTTETAVAHGATAEVWLDPSANPVLVNDEKLSAFGRASLEKTLGAGRVKAGIQAMVAEDFALFAERVPSFYFMLGVSNPEKGLTANVHTAAFEPDEDAIVHGAAAMTNLVLDYLGSVKK